MNHFKNRYGDWALIAGAAEGIGAAFTTLIAQRGMNIVMVDNNLPAMQHLAAAIKETMKVDIRQVHLDLSLSEAPDVLVRSVADLDCRLLVYVAAYSKVNPFLSMEPEQLERYIHVNSRTPMLLVHRFAGRLNQEKKPGGILLISSLAGLLGPPLVTPYAATKGFLIRLAESLSSEFTPLNIDITACCAGLTATPTYQENTPERTRNKENPMEPILLADYALRQLGKKAVCIAGWKNRFNFFLLLRILPHAVSLKIMGKTMKKMYETNK
jgi:hypothetical protein